MREILFVAIGGSLGALARYGVGITAAQAIGKAFPWGTLIVNVAGCFVMGMVIEVMANLEAHSPDGLTSSVRGQMAFWHKAVAIGFLGGLTTFSSFGADTVRELQAGHFLTALANITSNVVLSLFALWCGVAVMAALD